MMLSPLLHTLTDLKGGRILCIIYVVHLWWVPVELRDALYVVSLPERVVMDVRWKGGGKEPAQPQALLLPDLVALCQILPVPANLTRKISISEAI